MPWLKFPDSLFKGKGKKLEKQYPTPSSQKPSPYATPTTESPTCSRAYNDKWYWRWYTIFLVRAYKHEEVLSGVRQIGKHKIVKFGTTVQLSEAAALRYVSENSLIPVPQVYCAFRKDGVTYILMTRIDGEEIGLNWAKRSDGEKEQLVTQLKNIFEELRSMPHPRPGVIAAADMQALYDPRTWKGRLGFGPFANERDFTKFLRCGVHAEDDMLNKEFNSWVTDDERAEIGKMVALQDSKEHAICFTHGDISSSNILVKDGKVVALLDFELAGFYPEYWEYTTAIDVNPYDGFWEFEIPKFLKEYPEELEMETLRKKHFGPDGFRGTIPWT